MIIFRIRGVILAFLLLVSPFLFGFQNSRIVTEQGYYLLSVKFEEKPVKAGINSMRLTVYDRKSKKPVYKKLKLEVVPWMPSYVHALEEVPVVKDNGKGEYLIEKINFGIPGDWEVYVKIKNGSGEDSAVFNVSVVEE